MSSHEIVELLPDPALRKPVQPEFTLAHLDASMQVLYGVAWSTEMLQPIGTSGGTFTQMAAWQRAPLSPVVTHPWAPLPPEWQSLYLCPATLTDVVVSALLRTRTSPTAIQRPKIDALLSELVGDLSVDAQPALFPILAPIVLERGITAALDAVDVEFATGLYTTAGMS